MSDLPKYSLRDWMTLFATSLIVSTIIMGIGLIIARVPGAEDPAVSQTPQPTESHVMVEEPPAAAEPEPEPEPEPSEEPVEPVIIYDVPMDAELQLYIIEVCKEKRIEPSIVFAMIERESQFGPERIGDNGESFGLMQIKPKWHQDRMDKLGVTDLLDPYQNVLVGIDYLLELCEKYDDIEMALMSYNAGSGGAYEFWFSEGIFSNSYSQGVLERARTLREGMKEYVD